MSPMQLRYESAYSSTFHRICIGFASNLHRLCYGGSLEEHWRMEFPPPALAEVAEQVEVVETIYAQKTFWEPENYGRKG